MIPSPLQGGVGWEWNSSLRNAAGVPPSQPSPLVGEGVKLRCLGRLMDLMPAYLMTSSFAWGHLTFAEILFQTMEN